MDLVLITNMLKIIGGGGVAIAFIVYTILEFRTLSCRITKIELDLEGKMSGEVCRLMTNNIYQSIEAIEKHNKEEHDKICAELSKQTQMLMEIFKTISQKKGGTS